MAYLKTDDPEYWRSPGRFAALDRVIPTVRHTYFVVGDEGSAQSAALVMQMQPGHVINPHAHSSTVFEMVVAGSLEVDGHVLRPGDIMTLEPGEACGRAVAGPEGCTTVEFFGTVRGAHQLIYRGADGNPLTWDVLEQLRRPSDDEIAAT